jgi:hypothetical protein
MYSMRFDMRAPDFGAPATEVYEAAVDMCAWAETRGCLAAVRVACLPASRCSTRSANQGDTLAVLAAGAANDVGRRKFGHGTTRRPLRPRLSLAQGDVPGSQEAYEEACRAHGYQPGMTLLPNRDTPSVCFVAPDVDLAWREIGPHLLHDARAYAEWNPDNQTSAGIAEASDVDELRAMSRTHRIFTADEAIAHVRGGGMLTLSPLCGGIPPDIAWKYLRYVDEAVMPALRAAGG